MADEELTRRGPEGLDVPPPVALARPPPFAGRELPHNLEAEQAVLGAILLEETVFDQVQAHVKAGDFYPLAHQQVFTACAELFGEHRPIDLVTVQQRLQAKGLLGAQVPAALPFELARGLGTPANAVHYAQIVAEMAQLRNVIVTAMSLAQRGYDAGATVGEFLSLAETEIFRATQTATVQTLKTLKDAVFVAAENLDKIRERVQAGLSPITGVPTGIPKFDEMTLGLQPGALVILAARPSIGKTAFALNILTHAAVRADRKVAFFSLEMPADQLATRLLAAEARLDVKRLTLGHQTLNDWERIALHTEKLAATKVWIDDNFVLTPGDLRSKCRKLKREGGLDLVIVDYLQLMHSPSDRSSQSREQEIATISRSLKQLAKELSVPVVALSQLNRGVEKRKGSDSRPMLSDLRESGAIEQDADVVLFLHRPEAEDGDDGAPAAAPAEVQEIELIVAKQRQGPVGIVPLVFFKSHTRFAEQDRRQGP